MDPLRSAAPLARLLLAVSAARRDQELWIEQGARVARLRVRGGELVELSGVPQPPLGDVLRELEALDAERAQSLRDDAGAVPVGVRLIVAGATSYTAVQRALNVQRLRAVAALLRLPVTRVRRTHGSAVGHASDLTAAVWDALRDLAEQLPLAQRTALARPGQALVLTRCGQRYATPPNSDAERAILVALGFARTDVRREDSYALLLRKRRELARNLGPRALLDLPNGADAGGAQRALRRLAGKLHPDRFHADDARLQRVSHEVMGALTRAASMFVA